VKELYKTDGGDAAFYTNLGGGEDVIMLLMVK